MFYCKWAIIKLWMQTLSKFKKGDKTTLTYKRGKEEIKIDIEF